MRRVRPEIDEEQPATLADGCAGQLQQPAILIGREVMHQIRDENYVVACRVGSLEGVASHRADTGLQARGLDAALRQRDNLGLFELCRLDLGCL